MISDYINITIVSNNKTYIIKKVIEYQQDSDLNKFTQTMSFKLPLRVKDTDDNRMFSNSDSLIFKKNDKVSVNLGYTELNNLYINYNVFEGIINQVIIDYNNKQVTIECEDYFSLLKKMKFNFAIKNADVDSIFKHIVDELNVQYGEKYGAFTYSSNFKLNLDSYTCNNSTGAKLLEDINKKLLIDCHFFGNHVVFGTNLNHEFIEDNVKNDPYGNYYFTNNSINNIRSVYNKGYRDNNYCHILNSENLTRKVYNETLKSLTINTIDNYGNYKTKTFGDKNGETETLVFFKQNLKDIEEIAKSHFQRHKYQGFVDGSYFTALCYPLKKIGNNVKIDLFTDNNEIEESVTYLVTRVSVSFDVDNGLKQNIYLRNAYKLLEDKELDTKIQDIKIKNVVEPVIQKEYQINDKPLYNNISDSVFIKNAENINNIKKEQLSENKVEVEVEEDNEFLKMNDIDKYIKAAQNAYIKNADISEKNKAFFYTFSLIGKDYELYNLNDFIYTTTSENYDYEFIFNKMYIIQAKSLKILKNNDLISNKDYKSYLIVAIHLIRLNKIQFVQVKNRLKLDPEFVPKSNYQKFFVENYNEILNTTYVYEAEIEKLNKIEKEILSEINNL